MQTRGMEVVFIVIIAISNQIIKVKKKKRGAGASIPPFSPLVFEVELLDIL